MYIYTYITKISTAWLEEATATSTGPEAVRTAEAMAALITIIMHSNINIKIMNIIL